MKNRVLPAKAAVLLVLGVLYGIAPSHAKPAMPAPLTAETKAPPVPKAVFVDAAGGKHSVDELLGADGLGWSGEGYDKASLDATRAWLHSRAFSIYGGTYEIQNNVTAKRVLNLPEQ